MGSESQGGLKPGDRLGPYTIEDEIGRGGFATVYRANDPRFGGSVAIKVLAPHLASNAEAVERFVGEARALRSVHNDSVVSVFDVAGSSDRPYMVLQHADRGSLLERLIDGQPAVDDEIEQLIAFFSRALGALHGQTLVHRDIKPSNVLITSDTANPTIGGALLRPDDRLILGDLGLVKDLSSSPAVTRGSGSAAYAAPEQRAVVSRVDTRTDIYAASAVITEAAVGRLREPDESWEQLLDQLITQGRETLSIALRRGLSEDPDMRHGSVGDWSAELRSSLGPTKGSAKPGPSTSSLLAPAHDQPVGRRMLLPLVGLIALAAIAAGIFALNQTDGSTARTSTPGELLAAVEVEDAAVETDVVGAIAVDDTATTANVDTADRCGDPVRGVAEGLAPAGLTVIDATDTTATIEWATTGEPFSIFVNNVYFDNASKSSNQYVVEGLEAGSFHDIVMSTHGTAPADGALVCVTTESITAIDRLPVGPLMATNLLATDVTPTSVTLNWDSAASGGRYTLYSGTLAANKNFPDIVGAGGATPAMRSFVFVDLEPGTETVIGLRTILGDNQSGLAWIMVELPDQ